MSNPIKNYYQGIFLTETIMGNPNGDFLDNIPRNFDGHVFTTDKCIKYNVRKYMHDKVEKIEKTTDDDGNEIRTIENFIFFFPRLDDDANLGDSKFKTRADVFKYFDGECDFDKLLNNSPDIRMFGGTFSFKKSDKTVSGNSIPTHQIYGPIQLSYGLDINEAIITRLQIGSPFADGNSGSQTTIGSESVVDDAIISYDITINPNNHPNLLLEDDLSLFKESLWYGTNLRKSTSKKTDSKLLLLIKFRNLNDSNCGKVTSINMGELKNLIKIKNKEEHKLKGNIIELDCEDLSKKLEKYKEFIEEIEIYYDTCDLKIINFEENHFNIFDCTEEEINSNENDKIPVKKCEPQSLLKVN